MRFRYLSSLLPIFSAVFMAAAVSQAEPVRVGHVRAELISEVESVQPGTPFWVGLRLVMDDHWHVYWRNPGDAGLPPEIEWDVPEGWSVGEIQWPHPERFVVGPLVSYGYYKEVLLPIEITPPRALDTPIDRITLRATAKWLVCKEACIPGKTDLSLTLPVSGTTASVNAETAPLFNDVRFHLPMHPTDWQITASSNQRSLVLSLTPPTWLTEPPDSIVFLPYDKGLIHNLSPQELQRTDSGLTLTVELDRNLASAPDSISGILISTSGWRGPNSEPAMAVSLDLRGKAAPATASTDAGLISLWQALLFAFLGGIILNLMPCVLPVLSLKIMSFVNQAHERGRKPLAHGIVFTLGVLVSFWALAGLLLGLQAGGEQLGWGFQLQSPAFLVVLSAFLFLFGLNMLGVFEIGTSLTRVRSSKFATGWSGSFFSGILATVVATPCTAPFMGSALGFSLTQPALISLLIFTFLGLGMAAPYVVLSASPRLLRFVPKPGPWMETLKQVMGFLLLGTVVWLMWVLGIQAGTQAVTALAGALLLVSISAWIIGRWGGLAAAGPRRATAYLVALLLIGGGVATALLGARVSTPGESETSHQGSIAWQSYSPERLAELRAADKPVFVDFTAAWCLSCQVNEQVAFGSREVQRKFVQLGIVPLKADWTSRDEEITRALAEHGRNSVPLYVLYGVGDGQPIILPEILSPGIVLDALKQLES